jgi:hypothetical protein
MCLPLIHAFRNVSLDPDVALGRGRSGGDRRLFRPSGFSIQDGTSSPSWSQASTLHWQSRACWPRKNAFLPYLDASTL